MKLDFSTKLPSAQRAAPVINARALITPLEEWKACIISCAHDSSPTRDERSLVVSPKSKFRSTYFWCIPLASLWDPVQMEWKAKWSVNHMGQSHGRVASNRLVAVASIEIPPTTNTKRNKTKQVRTERWCYTYISEPSQRGPPTSSWIAWHPSFFCNNMLEGRVIVVSRGGSGQATLSFFSNGVLTSFILLSRAVWYGTLSLSLSWFVYFVIHTQYYKPTIISTTPSRTTP